MTERLVRIYPLFERFWQWSQALLIFALFASGLRVMGIYEAMPFCLAFMPLQTLPLPALPSCTSIF